MAWGVERKVIAKQITVQKLEQQNNIEGILLTKAQTFLPGSGETAHWKGSLQRQHNAKQKQGQY